VVLLLKSAQEQNYPDQDEIRFIDSKCYTSGVRRNVSLSLYMCKPWGYATNMLTTLPGPISISVISIAEDPERHFTAAHGPWSVRGILISLFSLTRINTPPVQSKAGG
jgi:hypothetical protein